VFAPEFITSLNGKPITDNHPEGMVNPDNFQEYSCGHIENVRAGKEPLDDGELPLIANLVICAEPLLGEVRNKTKREISLGYDYAIRKEGDKIIQCDMVGNHMAVVPHGRAGSSVKIHDSAPVVAAVPKTKKETKVAKLDWKHIFGLGLRAAAADSEIEPEQLTELAQQAAPPVAEEVADKKVKDKKKAADLEPEEEEEEPVAVDKKKAKDKKLSDHRQRMHDTLDRLLDGQEPEAEATDTDLEALKQLLTEFFSEEEGEAAHAADSGDTVGDILRIHKMHPEWTAEKIARETDADYAAGIKGPRTANSVKYVEEVLAKYGKKSGGADEEEEVIPEPASTEELDAVLAGGEEPEDEEEEEVADAEEAPGEEVEPDEEEELEEEAPAADRARAADAAKDGASAVLKMLRRSVAQCKDSAVKQDFNRALRSVTRSSRASTGSYGAFAGAAASRTDKLPHNPGRARAADSSQDAIAKMQAAYDAAHKGGK
jgi:hypothetical protein